MKKIKIVGVVVVSLLLISLIIYASTHHYDDSHLRLEGKRVRVPENYFVVDDCENANAVYCEKILEVNGEKQKLTFEFKDIKDNGYPKTFVAKINGNEFYKRDNLDLEDVMNLDYQIFLNFKVMDDYIVFTLTDGDVGRTTTLYAIDTAGNVILKEHDIDDDDMLIKDYTDFITYKDNTIEVYASKLVGDYTYNNVSICLADSDKVVEGYYTYTLKDGKFSKKQTKKITAKEFISNKGIICSED